MLFELAGLLWTDQTPLLRNQGTLFLLNTILKTLNW